MQLVTVLGLLLHAAPLVLCWSDWHNSNCAQGRNTMVHLFEWKWTDIEQECVRFLGPYGYCGVQLSPPMEHPKIHGRPWWERYQPVSYILHSRSGTREEFVSMVRTCNQHNVRIYPDLVINHMTGMGRSSDDEPGTAGSEYDADLGSYPSVPYTMDDFNTCDGCTGCCCINSWTDLVMVRNCRLVGLIDLKQDLAHTEQMIVDYINDMIDIGVAGFRIDAAKHMWPNDIQQMWSRLNNLNTEFFPEGSHAFMFLEVIDLDQQGEVNVHEYKHLGLVTEFRYCVKIGDIATYPPAIKGVFDPGWGMLDPDDAFVFVDNHDNQRGHGGGGSTVTHKDPPKYKMAQAITIANAMLDKGYGFARVMSSFDFGDDTERGPPADADGNTDDVPINADGSCGGGWVCEHRWPAIAGMAGWAKATNGEAIANEYESGDRYAFSRGNKGFVAFNDPNTVLQTGLPGGEYCNVVQGCATSSGCTGQSVTVNGDGTAQISITGEDPILAIHVEAMAGSNQCIDGSGEAPTVGTPGTTASTTEGTPGTTAAPTPAPTQGPTSTRPPGEGDFQRTVVFLSMETQPGQDMFIRGGIDHDQRPGCVDDAATSACAISIEHISLGTDYHYEKLNDWSDGDNHLDWYGVEVGQGTWQGIPADGTPAAWTTDDSTHPGYQPDNTFGEHYWKTEFYMDCSEAEDGWFELKGMVTNGPGWEGDITQDTCTGSVGGSAPYTSTNHMGQCGHLNVFSWNSGSCQIDAI